MRPESENIKNLEIITNLQKLNETLKINLLKEQNENLKKQNLIQSLKEENNELNKNFSLIENK